MTDNQPDIQPPRRLTVSSNGRVLIPAEMRDVLGVRAGGTVMVKVEGDRLILEPLSSTLTTIREWAQKLVAPGESLVDELIAERRRESAHE